MKNEMDKHKNVLLNSMRACVENGLRLHQDAELLSTDRSPTVVALCILAQEEFAKAFLLQLVREGIIPWSAKVRDSLHNHSLKQLIGFIMEWLRPSDDEWATRIEKIPGVSIFPVNVADAMKLYVKKVQPKRHITCPPAPSDPIAKSVADGDRDKIKQDALYVKLSEDGDVISVPAQVTPETVEAELDKTKRLCDLVSPLIEGSLAPSLDYPLMKESMKFLFMDKSNRPFLILKELEFDVPSPSSTSTTWPHSITVSVENISDKEAICVNGHVAVYLDKEMVKPLILLNSFSVDPGYACPYTFFVSEETYASGMSSSHTLDLSISLEYRGVASDRKYKVWMWSEYDPQTGAFKVTVTDSVSSMNDKDPAQVDVETKWMCPTNPLHTDHAPLGG